MARLISFTQVSLDGCYADARSDMSWAHKDDPEQRAFVEENAGSGGTLVFGRITYEMMAGYWPTPMAAANNPVVAERMNALPKIVFSRTLGEAPWNNTTLVRDDMEGFIRTKKEEPGNDMVILGSGSIVAQLAQARLIDEIQVVVNPIVLGDGKRLFAGLAGALKLTRTKERSFGNGNILLCYEVAE